MLLESWKKPIIKKKTEINASNRNLENTSYVKDEYKVQVI